MPDGDILLKLVAFDADDLTVISAHLQDAVLTVGDIKYTATPAEVGDDRQTFRLAKC